MAIIRHVSIRHFRGISEFDWCPSEGTNCLIGPGDSGKSTILDAIDWCLSPRRFVAISESDYFRLDDTKPITIELTLGALSDDLLNIEAYVPYFRGFDANSEKVEDEPGTGLETVLTVRMEVKDDHIPRWRLFSERADVRGGLRDLIYKDRFEVAPTRLGAYADSHLAWGQRSILNRLADDKPDSAQALSKARKDARKSFVEGTGEAFDEVLKAVKEVADEFAVNVGDMPKAILDTQQVAIATGAIALHDARDVPLRRLGLGSSRLLVAGLQRKARRSEISLIDEVEHGLEPYRIVQLLHAIGSKASKSPQIFATTHSSVVIRELSILQIFVLRAPTEASEKHRIYRAGENEDNQPVLRACAEGFLSPRVLVCEGKTEIGFLRGRDIARQEKSQATLARCGVCLVDGNGSQTVARAEVFAGLGYEVAILRDNDQKLTAGVREKLAGLGVKLFEWPEDFMFEAALFQWCPAEAIADLIKVAEDYSASTNADVSEDIRWASDGQLNRQQCLGSTAEQKTRDVLVKASTRKYTDKGGREFRRNWFKLIEPAEQIGRNVIPKHFSKFDNKFQDFLISLRDWIEAKSRAGPSAT